MKNSKYFFILVFAGFFIGCNTTPENPVQFANPASPNSVYPNLYNVGDQLYMSWITQSDNKNHSLNYASYSDNEWTTPKTIATDSTWFVNWADFPSVIADKNGPIAAHWLNLKNPGPLAYDVQISTVDDSNGWTDAFIPHDDGTSTEHGFVSMIPWDNGSFLAVWLDGRQTEGRSDEDYYELDNAMTLRGAIISSSGTIQQRFLIDDAVCDCCPTSLVKTTDGAVVAYRNRTNNEIRDIYTSQFNGEEWTSPKAVYDDGWKIGACPVNGPKLAAEDSLVAIAWHTGTNGNPTAKYAYSMDNGTSFSEPVILNKGTSLGRVDAEIYRGISYLSWMEKTGTQTTLKLASFKKDKTITKAKTIAKLNESRRTGFPQMEQSGNNLIFAWTNPDTAQTQVITKKMSLTP